MSLKHFKELKNIVQNQGIGAALEYDLIETAKKYPKIATTIAIMSMSMSKPAEIMGYRTSEEKIMGPDENGVEGWVVKSEPVYAGSQTDPDSENLLGKFEPPTYTGTFMPEADMTFGISEHGPWSAKGDQRLYKPELDNKE